MTLWISEQRNPASADLDQLPTLELCRLINRQDAQVPLAVAEALPQIARGVDAIAAALAAGHRLFYMGAGTSGRLGVLDASELLPTFSFPSDRLVALIAGGPAALTRSVEAAEDDLSRGREDLITHQFTAGDLLVALAASGRTPYTIAGLRYAAEVGATSIAVVCNPSSPMAALATIAVEVVTGPEVVTGSTRMKAGTAQKLVLNMLSTGAMIKLGKVYENLMVDVQPTNQKLRERAVRIVVEASSIAPDQAARLLAEAGWEVKVAVVMALLDVTADEARNRLAASRGHVRAALSSAPASKPRGRAV
jgi:N-acetylmuramic acid 6-phosphate etherase